MDAIRWLQLVMARGQSKQFIGHRPVSIAFRLLPFSSPTRFGEGGTEATVVSHQMLPQHRDDVI